jgi:hypothetical protein
LDAELSDCFCSFFKQSSIREREYLREQEFLLDFEETAKKVVSGVLQNIPIRFPNGNVTQFPSDVFMFFECQSLKDSFPSFISSVGIVHT